MSREIYELEVKLMDRIASEKKFTWRKLISILELSALAENK